MRFGRLALIILSVSSAFATLSCGETVVSSTATSTGASVGGAKAGAGGTATGTPVGAGGQGGESPTCGPSCLECCNDDACPRETPSVGDECTAPLDCNYVTTGGCLQHWFCANGDPEPDSWSSTIGSLEDGAHACPGECPPNGPDPGYLCFEEGMTCPYQLVIQGEDKGCWSYTCQADHHWTSGEKIGDVCP